MYSRLDKKNDHFIHLPNTKTAKLEQDDDFRIKSTIAAHDRTQLETVFDYPILPRRIRRQRTLKFFVEAYLFFPQQMGITPHTYTKERFYADLRPLIRFREPRFSFRELLGQADTNTPIDFLQDYVASAARGQSKEPIHRAIAESRYFACSFASYFLRRISKRTKALGRILQFTGSHPHESLSAERSLQYYLEETLELLSRAMYILKTLRQLLVQAEALPGEQWKPLVHELRFVDEYCTYRFRDGLASLLKVITDFSSQNIQSFDFPRFVRRIVAYSRLEHWYTLKQKYRWIESESDAEEVENFLYRRGSLKRRIWSVLYLTVRKKQLFAVQRQMAAMFAAGLASLWWAVATYFIAFGPVPLWGNQQVFWQSSGFLIITASMLAYILKDRIKENSRNFLSGTVFSKVPDNSEKIFYEPAYEDPVSVGSIQEFTRFLPAEELPNDIRILRAGAFADPLEADDAPRHIIRYRKVIEFYPKAIEKQPYPIRAIHDIIRLNISSYLTRLDDPQAGTDIISADGRHAQMKIPKVYHLDIVLKHTIANLTSKGRQDLYDHFRLIINKNGIYRLERL